jgi:hypothetical protein
MLLEKVYLLIRSYGHICKRINKLNVDINDHDRKNVDDDDDDDDKYIIIAVDSTGIKVTNMGQWMDEKWNVKTKKILALEVTNEKVHDGRRIITKLVNHVLDNHAMKIESVLVDGAHDTTKILDIWRRMRSR